ncbi:MAG: hypothetical protein KAS88_03465 [Deltaproteobacteria bacterium]|nr:hypothetical protein [Deltaproteobacteria bacterium]
MRTKISVLIVFFALVFLLPSNSNAEWSGGISLSDDSGNSFSLDVGDYYGVSDRDVKKVKTRGMADDDMAVAFSLSGSANVNYDDVVSMRLSGSSWNDITLELGLNAGTFYEPVRTDGPPYGKAHGYYKNKPKGGWGSVKLSDSEIVDLVNTKFISEHYGLAASEVVKMRGGGKSFKDINESVKGKKDKGAREGGNGGGGKGKGGNGRGKR